MCINETKRYALCSGCDLLVQLPKLNIDEKALCPRCNNTLALHQDKYSFKSVSYSIAGLFTLLLSMCFPFMSIRIQGALTQIYLLEIPQVLASDHYNFIAMIFLGFVIFIPLFCFISIFLLAFKQFTPQFLRVFLARWLFRFKEWSMGEIFLMGVFVSFVKLSAYGDIGIGLSFIPYCFFSILQIKALQTVDRYAVWETISASPPLSKQPIVGQTGIKQGLHLCLCCTAILSANIETCPRCQHKVNSRRSISLQWTLALLVTSILLYIPANILPIMITESLGNKLASTIMSGVIFMWNDGSYPVALVIFIASIMIPTLKIISLFWLCSFAGSKTATNEKDCCRMWIIYQVIEFVGRWSMIDIFVISVLSSLVRMGILMGVYPDIGAILFAMVVFITMTAVITFDPRLLWDRLEATEDLVNLNEWKTDGI